MHASHVLLLTSIVYAGVATLTVRELFDFAVDPTINNSNMDAALERLMTVATRCGRELLVGE